MNIPPKSVIVSHPAKQHAYQVALALQRAGVLQRFITGIYFKPTAFPYTMIRWLPAVGQVRLAKELRKRYFEELQGDLIISVPYFEILSKITGKIPFVSDEMRLLFANWLHDLYVSHWITRCHPQPSIVYGFEGASLLSFRTARSLGVATVLDVPVAVNIREIIAKDKERLGLETDSARLERRIRNRFEQELYMADCVITPSQHVAESVVAMGVSPSKVAALPYGVDLERFRPNLGRLPSSGGEKFRALFIGKFAVYKGVCYLLEAWQQLALPDSELIVVGPDTDIDYARAMRAKYGEIFVGYGNVPHDQIADLYAQGDVFILPSISEGFGLVCLEAMASGLPCILTSSAGSMLRDGIEGFIIPPYDVEALKDRILRLYRDKDLRRQMGTAARQRAEEFTWQRYHTRLVELLSQ